MSETGKLALNIPTSPNTSGIKTPMSHSESNRPLPHLLLTEQTEQITLLQRQDCSVTITPKGEKNLFTVYTPHGEMTRTSARSTRRSPIR